MKNYSTSITAELAKEQFAFFIALKLEFTATHYYCDFDHPVHYSGNRYLKLDMRVSNINYASAGSVDSVNLEVGNADFKIYAVY